MAITSTHENQEYQCYFAFRVPLKKQKTILGSTYLSKVISEALQ